MCEDMRGVTLSSLRTNNQATQGNNKLLVFFLINVTQSKESEEQKKNPLTKKKHGIWNA